MNYVMIRYMLGWVCYIEAAFMTLPLLVSLIYRETAGYAFLITIGILVLVGFLLTRWKPKTRTMYVREGLVITAFSWILLSGFGAIPFLLSGEITSVEDALFETVSGFTTTGASILSDVEALSHACLFWRSFTHWVGGMGVLVFILAVLPMQGGSSVHIMRAESPGPSVSKLVPRIRRTAMILYGIYLCMTVVEIIILLLCGMPVFDALTTSFGTAGTGGFGIKNDSIASYSVLCQSVIALFMVAFGVNFNIYYLILRRKISQAAHSTELWTYLIIITVSILAIGISIFPMFADKGMAFHQAFFQVASIITTTGFATTDFGQWPEIAKTILVALMFVGACAGSTGGGIKVSRIIILLKGVKKEIAMICHPRTVKKVKVDGKALEHDVVRSVNVFIMIYLVIFIGSLFIIALDEKDLVTNFTAVAATINNIGPGLELVGPTGNFGGFSPLSKLVLMFDMLAGRLELLPMLMLFIPATWKK